MGDLLFDGNKYGIFDINTLHGIPLPRACFASVQLSRIIMKRWVEQIPFHPFLVAGYPVLALMANNLGESAPRDGLRSLFLGILGAAVLLAVCQLLLRESGRAALISTLGLLLFFSYGHIYSALKTVQFLGNPLGRHRYLLPAFIAVFVFAFHKVWIRRSKPIVWTRSLNIFSIVLVLIPVTQIGSFQIAQASAVSRQDARSVGSVDLNTQPGGTLRDVYYIILDGYTREDTLEDYFLYDNSAFIQALERMDFFVADGSQSNYAWTHMSLGSSLNMTYVQDLDPSFSNGDAHRTDLIPFIQRNDVRRIFSEVGYEIVAFESGFQPTDWKHADIYFPADSTQLKRWQSWGRINAFEAMLIQSSMGLILTDSARLLPHVLTPDVSYPYLEHRERILAILRNLEQVPHLEGPKFVFAHILVPHSPMIFGPNGEFMYPDEPFTLQSDMAAVEEFKYQEKIQGYRHQVAFISGEIERVVGKIIESSEVEPIIILQGDHGGPLRGIPIEARMSILNAYHFPAGGETRLYETISPVNTFRLIFTVYFGGDNALLEDVAYFSPFEERFRFEVIPNDFVEEVSVSP